LKIETYKINTANLFEKIEKKTQEMEVMEAWYRQYIWESQNVPINQLRALCICLDRILKYRVFWMLDLCLENILELTTKLKPTELKKDEALFAHLETNLLKIEKDNKNQNLIEKIGNSILKLRKV
jgi:hypothetical protein